MNPGSFLLATFKCRKSWLVKGPLYNEEGKLPSLCCVTPGHALCLKGGPRGDSLGGGESRACSPTHKQALCVDFNSGLCGFSHHFPAIASSVSPNKTRDKRRALFYWDFVVIDAFITFSTMEGAKFSVPFYVKVEILLSNTRSHRPHCHRKMSKRYRWQL